MDLRWALGQPPRGESSQDKRHHVGALLPTATCPGQVTLPLATDPSQGGLSLCLPVPWLAAPLGVFMENPR